LRFPKRLLSGIAAGALGVSGLALALGGATPAGAAATSVTIAGATRYGTAAAVAAAAFPTGSINGITVLASGENFPDGLTASGLAGTLNSPILLTPGAALAAETINALGTLKTNTVDVVGGAAAVSANVIAQLKAFGYTVNVIAGADRYGTASAVAAAMAAIKPLGTFNSLPTAILATGANFPDALSAGVAAWTNHLPILLTDPNTLSASTSASLTAFGIKQVIQMGGTSAISAAVTTAVKAMGISVVGVAGPTRFDTAAAMANLEFAATAPTFGYPANPAFAHATVLVSGLNFPDALTAVQLAGHEFAPVLLDDAFPAVEGTFLSTNSVDFNLVQTVGGSAAVATADTASAVSAINGAAITGTISAIQGGNSFSVTFSGAVNAATAASIGNYLINNVALTAPDQVVYPAAANTALIVGLHATDGGTGPGGTLAPGDVISVSGVTAPSGTVSVAPFTVGVDTSTPTASAVYAYPGQAVFAIKFSKPTIEYTGHFNNATDPTNAGGGDNQLNVVITGAGANGAPSANPTGVGVVSADATGLAVQFTAPHVFAQGDTITISPGGTPVAHTVMDLAGNKMAPFTFTVISTTSGPSIASATHTVSPGTSATSGANSNVVLAALATGIAGGVAGNTYNVTFTIPGACAVTTAASVSQQASTPATAVSPAITNFTVAFGCTGAAHETAPTAVAELNNNSTPINGVAFNAVFNASTAAVVAATAHAAALLAGGTSSITETIVFSAPLFPASGIVGGTVTFDSHFPGATDQAGTTQSTSGAMTAAGNYVDSQVLPTTVSVTIPVTAAQNSYALPAPTGGSTITITPAGAIFGYPGATLPVTVLTVIG
jgi:putative cell wall-binding protein